MTTHISNNHTRGRPASAMPSAAAPAISAPSTHVRSEICPLRAIMSPASRLSAVNTNGLRSHMPLRPGM